MSKKRNLYFEVAAQHSAGLRWIEVISTEEAARWNVNGRSIPSQGVIIVRRPDSLFRLRIFLHECAHCKLHRKPTPGAPYHQIELEAERYAFVAIAEAGITVAKQLLTTSRDAIFGELGADLRAGFSPAPGVFEYLGFSQEQSESYLAQMCALPRTDAFLRNQPNSWGSRQWARAIARPGNRENPK